MSSYEKIGFIEFLAKSDGVTGNGDNRDMLYKMSLAGPEGAEFTLLREPHHTREDVNRAKKELKHQQDAVRFYIVHEDKSKMKL